MNRKRFASGILLLVGLLYWVGTPVRGTWAGGRWAGASHAAPSAIDPRAQKVEQILSELEQRQGHQNSQPTRFLITESELNVYLAAKLEERNKGEIKQLVVRLNRDSFLTELTVILDKVELEVDPVTAAMLRSILSGKQVLQVVGEIETHQGHGAFRVREARLNGRTVPQSMVQVILKTIGERHEPPFDPTTPFELPLGIQDIRIETGLLTIIG